MSLTHCLLLMVVLLPFSFRDLPEIVPQVTAIVQWAKG
jgi:hypothetical protein